jgi:hypothetical protein
MNPTNAVPGGPAPRDDDRDRPSAVPSVPDLESRPGRHDEQPATEGEDRMPAATVRPGEDGTPALLRLRVEQLLRRREAPPTEAWAELGRGAPALLIRMLDDPAVARHEALRQRVIATLGQLDVAAAVPRLADILRDRRETPLTRTFAASALGQMQGEGVVDALGRAITDRDEMVRGEVARAFGRTQDPEAVPYLASLLNDPSGHVATSAAAQLRAFERRLGLRLDIPADLLPPEPETRDLAPRAEPISPIPEG